VRGLLGDLGCRLVFGYGKPVGQNALVFCPKACRVNLDRPMNLGNRLACLPRIVHSLTLRSRVQECFTANLECMLEHVQSRVGRVLGLMRQIRGN
jgi:hypothetical protein